MNTFLKTNALFAATSAMTEVESPKVSRGGPKVNVRNSWLTLQCGRAANGSEFIYALTGNQSFLMSANRPENAVGNVRAASENWAYLFDGMADELLDDCAVFNEVVIPGFKVVSGETFANARGKNIRRAFVLVELLYRQKTLLLRDPSASFASAWIPEEAIPLGDASEICFGNPIQAIPATLSRPTITGDAGIDALLFELFEEPLKV